jgi:CDP-glucose 4,6-dehydratase
MNPSFWRGKKVFVTGHTGFKGGWLTLWLGMCGAEVHGFATAAPTIPSLFEEARVADALARHVIGDVRDAEALRRALHEAAPDVVFHLAAQPLVRYSYDQPVETYAVNVLGTVNLLEAVRSCPSVRAVVNVTTDKCYDNREWHWGYRESEAMGGRDPYSSSKACSELVTAAYRDSFLAKAGVAVGSGRAGNVIGGGDWASDRLIPDFFRALQAKDTLQVRFPGATRPWQHVLEPLSGYLLLAEQLHDGAPRAAGWNFGPSDEDAWTVRRILDHLCAQVPSARWKDAGGKHVHEAGYLKLDSSKARAELGWAPRWRLDEALRRTVDWQQAWAAGQDMHAFTLAQITAHQAGDAG